MEFRTESGKLLTLLVGDITRVPVDAIVNAANSSLMGGGGVDGAIHKAGGPAIMKELDAIRARSGACPTGSAVVTSAGTLPANYVIHAVGPRYRDGKHGEPEQLANCYRKAFELANERSVKSISFPAISTGIYGYPVQDAAAIAVREIVTGLRESNSVTEVALVLYNHSAYQVHAEALRALQTEA